ncbi:hypothetical protein DPMN_106535 [Dreissena polymorpha]|uniref:Ion transport domain-containing protein n=1 Tax=Dreissena polymorpha TaxID=45954 RepID=A0A9D4K5C0_DREPO|nr:hypothetical protein DPMN_106535 [Dreissena polymorpha]
MPFMAAIYWLVPRSRPARLLRSPFMKFLYHSASFGVFLLLLIVTSVQVSSIAGRQRQRGPPPTEFEWLISIWVAGFIWSECKQLWEEGAKAYLRQWWNWLDFIMLSLYLTTITLRFLAYIQIESGRYGPRELDRKYWPLYDPTIVSEGLFAVANVFSFARIIFLCQACDFLFLFTCC